jgi:hypothetical protein
MRDETSGRGRSRRDFLKGLGVTGAGLVAGSVSAGADLATPPAEAAAAFRPGRRLHGHGGGPASSVDFSRIFPHLRPFAEATTRVRAALLEVGRPGGVMDAADQLSAGPKGFDALDESGHERLYEDLAALAAHHDREPGPLLAIPSEYVEAVAVRAS